MKDINLYGATRIPFSDISPDSYISTDNILPQCGGVVPYDGALNIGSVVKYVAGDILVSNIRPYLKKLWLADRDGGCSPDVLVFRVTKPEVIDAGYLSYCLKQDSFFEFMMSGKKGMKMPRGDKGAIPNFVVPVPPLDKQKKIVAEVEGYEAEIAKARAVMVSASVKKQAILKSYGIVL